MAQVYRNPMRAGVTRLYHYQRFNPAWLATTLSEQKVHCANPANLNDPWDCEPCFDDRSFQINEFLIWLAGITDRPLPDVQRAASDAGMYHDPDVAKQQLALFSDVNLRYIARLRIYCLTPDPCSTLMWSHYAENHQGICLAFRTDNNVLFRCAQEVFYRSDYPKWVPQDLSEVAIKMILTKAKDWSYEREFRLIARPEVDETDPLKLYGDYLRIPSDALETIIVGCRGDYEAVCKNVNEHAPGLPVKRAVRTPNRYGLTIEDVARR
jgi:hypothetical protein